MRCSRLIFLFLLLATPATCFSWPAKVFSFAAGDTIIVLHNSQQAKALTSALVAGQNVDVERKDIDQYKRIFGLVKVDGQSLNELIV